jgi:hypothetical protein
MLYIFVNCARVRLNFFFFNCQRRNKDHCALVNCRGVEFLKLKYVGAFSIVNCGMKEKDFIQVRNEYSPQPSKLL